MKEAITVNGEEREIDVTPLTIVCHPGDLAIGFPKRLPLDAEATVHHGRLVKKRHARTDGYLARLFPSKVESLGYYHALGLIDMSLKLMDMGVPFAWIMPETYLHPRQQVELAQVMIEMAKPPATPGEEVKV